MIHSHFLKKFLKETFHFSGCWLLQRCPLYSESVSKSEVFKSKHEISTICHDIPSPDLLEGPKDGKIKGIAKFFSF